MFNHFKKPSELIDELGINNCSGIYVVRLKDGNAFRNINIELDKEYAERPVMVLSDVNKKYFVDESIIYIGKGNGQDGLLKRFKQEFLHIGNGTLFRTIGAVLHLNPYVGQNNPKNYRFQNAEKQTIIDFIERNFEVSYENEDDLYKFFGENSIENIEKKMININIPVFNKTHNPSFSVIVMQERERCRKIASQNADIISSNAYVRILNAQKQNNWCANNICTTCGARDLRNAIIDIKHILFISMMDLNVSELKSFENYKEVTRIAVDYLELEERVKIHHHWPTIFNEIGRAVLL